MQSLVIFCHQHPYLGPSLIIISIILISIGVIGVNHIVDFFRSLAKFFSLFMLASLLLLCHVWGQTTSPPPMLSRIPNISTPAATGDVDLDRAMKICVGVRHYANYQTCDWNCFTPYSYTEDYKLVCEQAETAWEKSDTARQLREAEAKRKADLTWLQQWSTKNHADTGKQQP